MKYFNIKNAVFYTSLVTRMCVTSLIPIIIVVANSLLEGLKSPVSCMYIYIQVVDPVLRVSERDPANN